MFKGKKMAGHMGARARYDAEPAWLCKTDTERGLIMVKGSPCRAPRAAGFCLSDAVQEAAFRRRHYAAAGLRSSAAAGRSRCSRPRPRLNGEAAAEAERKKRKRLRAQAKAPGSRSA